MVLNYIWIAFFLAAFITAAIRLVFMGDTSVFPEIINSTFESSKTAFDISLGLTGVLSLWMGIMKVGEARRSYPVFLPHIKSSILPLIPGYT